MNNITCAKEVMKMTAPMHNHRFLKKRMKERSAQSTRRNPYYDYELNKKTPDPLDYETWIKRLAFDLRI